MRIQSLALQLFSLTTKFHTLNCSIIPTSNTLDQLINSGLHIPEVFLDEQDRLEAAVQEMDSGETIKFYLALMDQYKESDEIWFDQRTLEAKIDRLRRDVDSQISSNQTQYGQFQLNQSQARCNTQPTINSEGSDQGECQITTPPDLRLGSDWLLSSLDALTEGARIYKLAINTLESFKVQKRLKNNCKERLTDLIDSVKDLDWLYPSRHWELLNSKCLKVGPEERDYKEAYKRLDLELQETTLNSSGLLKIVDNLLLRLDSPSINHNTKITLRAISSSLLDRVSEARKITDLFLAPLTSHKICSKVIEMGKFETPYVVMIHSGQIISSNNASKSTGATSMKSAMINEQGSYGSGRVQEVWSFNHLRTDVVFSQETGYFRARLYGDVLIKTHPESKMSREMVQLIGGDDINPEDYDSVERAWSRYIESYSDISIERTIGLDGIKVKEPFLKRNLKLVKGREEERMGGGESVNKKLLEIKKQFISQS
ncbi:hypothetical protein PPACK8108_LOCUS19890 [Phakopsora pachyrhizi]|uniref:Sin3 C-terminal domain-containing protein n=1 Tax=Phakopsora pachyrhizi TaxID=170000 RepID=A0AAV0BEK5_PHAPC|nr:hypothetical protein PPACK8108_LOCUS19890 [Phakopsora pachyrhizi]